MSPLPFHILLALAQADSTGAQLLRQAESDVASALILRQRSLYTALQNLVKQGLVMSEGSGRAAIYRLSRSGRLRLQAEKTRLSRAVRLLHERV
jgi:DNA-binding PadR family transcriptional regulator